MHSHAFESFLPFPDNLRFILVGRINSHVQGTKPNADSAFAEYSISSARTHELNTITFTYYATSIPRYDLRVVLRVTGEPRILKGDT
jgi:hypothetical protein